MAVAISRHASTIRDYIELGKPRVVASHVLTAFAAMTVAVGGAPPVGKAILTLVGGGLVAVSANALNCYLDRDIDATMARTRGRALPSQRVAPPQALAFAIAAGFAGMLMLTAFAGIQAAALSMAALLYYVLVYTFWLKRRTWLSAVVGAGVGAFPPLVGWVSMTGRVDPAALAISGVIIVWTLPHFWALALSRRPEYERAGVRIPKAGLASVSMIALSVLAVAGTFLLWRIAGMGFIFLVTALVFGLLLVLLSLEVRGKGLFAAARRLYSFSIFYLVVIFVAMVADRFVF